LTSIANDSCKDNQWIIKISLMLMVLYRLTKEKPA